MSKRVATAVILILMAVGIATAATVRLGWNANTETDLAGYRLYERRVPAPFNMSVSAAIRTFGPTDTEMPDDLTLPNDGETYCWVLTAFDQAGNTSGPSNEVCFTTVIPDVTPPTPPTGLNCAHCSNR